MSSAALGSHPHVLAGADVSPVIEPNRAEGSLHETECMNTRWREEDRTLGSLVALVGYVLLRIGAPELRAVEAIAAGGDTRYGLGRLQRIEWTTRPACSDAP